jgi:hypothetical protein
MLRFSSPEIGENDPAFGPNTIFSPIGIGHAHKDATYVGVDLNLAYFSLADASAGVSRV